MLVHIHSTLAVLTLIFFSVQVMLKLTNNTDMLAKPWLKVAPHVLNTILLALGIIMATQYGMWTQGWVHVKIACVVAYIAVGIWLMKRASTPLAIIMGAVLGWSLLSLIFYMAFAKPF